MANICKKSGGPRQSWDGWFCTACGVKLSNDPNLKGPKLIALYRNHIDGDDTGRISEPSKDGKGGVEDPK